MRHQPRRFGHMEPALQQHRAARGELQIRSQYNLALRLIKGHRHGQEAAQSGQAVDQRSELDTLVQQNTPTRLIAMKMGRTLEAISRKAKQKGISLKSTGQLPYRTKEW